MCPILPNLPREQRLVFRHPVTVGMQLNVDAVPCNLPNLSRVHELQNSFCVKSGVVDPEKVRETGSEIIFLKPSHLLPVRQVNQASHHPVAASLRTQIQGSL